MFDLDVFLTKLKQRALFYYNYGFKKIIFCIYGRLRLYPYYIKFRFDKWHMQANYLCRPYKNMVVELVNDLDVTGVIEIGCGLGDILANINVQARVGVDSDAGVIKACEKIYDNNIVWINKSAKNFDFSVMNDNIECLIMVNWIHNLNQKQLLDIMLPAFKKINYLIVDSIDKDTLLQYRYKHDFSFLKEHAKKIIVKRVKDEPRSFLVFKVKK